jgi:hypothetical protein
MKIDTEKNVSPTKAVTNSLTKRSWQFPEIEEVDYTATEAHLTGHGTDGDSYS